MDHPPAPKAWKRTLLRGLRRRRRLPSRLGRTITETDNNWFTCLTLNTNQMHFNDEYAKGTPFGQPLVNCAFTLSVVSGPLRPGHERERDRQPGLDRHQAAQPRLRRRHAVGRDRGHGRCVSPKSRPNVGIVSVRTPRDQPAPRGRHRVQAHVHDLQALCPGGLRRCSRGPTRSGPSERTQDDHCRTAPGRLHLVPGDRRGPRGGPRGRQAAPAGHAGHRPRGPRARRRRRRPGGDARARGDRPGHGRRGRRRRARPPTPRWPTDASVTRSTSTTRTRARSRTSASPSSRPRWPPRRRTAPRRRHCSPRSSPATRWSSASAWSAGARFHARGFHPTARARRLRGHRRGRAAARARRGDHDEGARHRREHGRRAPRAPRRRVVDEAPAPRLRRLTTASSPRAWRRTADGPDTVIEGRFGLYNAFLDRDDLDRGRSSPTSATRWETPRIAFKPYPACHYVHSLARRDPRGDRRAAAAPDDIERDRRDLDRGRALSLVLEPLDAKHAPRSEYDAKFSLPYSVAALLVRGKAWTSGPTPATAIREPRVLELAARVATRSRTSPPSRRRFPGRDPHHARRRARARGRAGRYQRGGPENPMAPDDVARSSAPTRSFALGRDDVDAARDRRCSAWRARRTSRRAQGPRPRRACRRCRHEQRATAGLDELTDEQQDILATIRHFVDKRRPAQRSQYDHAKSSRAARGDDEGARALRDDDPGGVRRARARPVTYALIVKELSRGWISLSGVVNTHFIAVVHDQDVRDRGAEATASCPGWRAARCAPRSR